MMGSTHAVSGAAAWVTLTAAAPTLLSNAGISSLSDPATLPLLAAFPEISRALPSLAALPTDPLGVIAGAVVCAGAALLPDADHPSATIAHSVPVLGRAAAGTVGALSGGHRQGLHSLPALLAAVVAASALGGLLWHPSGWGQPLALGAGIATAALLAWALKVLRVTRSWALSWCTGVIAAGALTLAFPAQLGWFPLCVGVGFLAHLLGDFLTVGGINWLWPLRLKRPKALTNVPGIAQLWRPGGHFALPLLGRTGSWREHALGIALTLVVALGVIRVIAQPIVTAHS